MKLDLDHETLEPLLRRIVQETITQLDESRAALNGDRLAYSEPEAAQLLALKPHQLRDERLRGRIAASHITGGKIRYLRSDLIDYLMSRRQEVTATK